MRATVARPLPAIYAVGLIGRRPNATLIRREPHALIDIPTIGDHAIDYRGSSLHPTAEGWNGYCGPRCPFGLAGPARVRGSGIPDSPTGDNKTRVQRA